MEKRQGQGNEEVMFWGVDKEDFTEECHLVWVLKDDGKKKRMIGTWVFENKEEGDCWQEDFRGKTHREKEGIDVNLLQFGITKGGHFWTHVLMDHRIFLL